MYETDDVSAHLIPRRIPFHLFLSYSFSLSHFLGKRESIHVFIGVSSSSFLFLFRSRQTIISHEWHMRNGGFFKSDKKCRNSHLFSSGHTVTKKGNEDDLEADGNDGIASSLAWREKNYIVGMWVLWKR